MLAHELHDEIGQILTTMKINLQSLPRIRGERQREELLAGTTRLVDRALDQMRTLSLALRPSLLDDLGLPAALRWLGDQQTRLAGVAVPCVAELPGRLGAPLETACFRIVQEALTNAIRHAGTRTVAVALELAGMRPSRCRFSSCHPSRPT